MKTLYIAVFAIVSTFTLINQAQAFMAPSKSMNGISLEEAHWELIGLSFTRDINDSSIITGRARFYSWKDKETMESSEDAEQTYFEIRTLFLTNKPPPEGGYARPNTYQMDASVISLVEAYAWSAAKAGLFLN